MCRFTLNNPSTPWTLTGQASSLTASGRCTLSFLEPRIGSIGLRNTRFAEPITYLDLKRAQREPLLVCNVRTSMLRLQLASGHQ